MADGQPIALSLAQAEALAALSAHFKDALTPLSPSLLGKIGDAGTVGWSIPLPADFTGSERTLWIVLAASFPEIAPVVFVKPSAYGEWPHVTYESAMCMWPEGLSPVGLPPEPQIRVVLDRVAEILSTVYPEPDRNRIRAEFAREWLSYWLPRDGAVAHATALLLQVPPTQPSVLVTRTVTMADRRRFMLIGGDDDHQKKWAAAFGYRLQMAQPLDTVYVPLQRPVIGAPTSLDGLLEILHRESSAAAELLLDRLRRSDGPIFVILALVGDAPSFAALELTLIADIQPQRRAPHNAKEARNRRRRRLPDRWRVKVMPIERADASWIHGRGFDAEAASLANAHVWVIGCGSLGGLVIRGLAAAGVGRMTLVDDERLEPPNLGRHVLAVADLGRYKAVALAEQIHEQLPHLRVDALTKKYPQVRPPTGAEAPDLIISTTANWPADLRAMNAVARGEYHWVQITWAEPHAVAGHSLIIDPASDPRSLFSDEGRFLRETTTWPTAARPLPGCAGMHQPGTFNRLQRVAGLAVEHAISHLLGHRQPEHLAWLGDSATLGRLGGSWRGNVAAPKGVRERTLALPVPVRSQ